MTTTKAKPPYSKCRRLQLCSRCNRYCGRAKNMCPTCEDRDDAQRAVLASISEGFPTLERLHDYKHLVGKFGSRGLFICWNDRQVLDRETYRMIVQEAKAAGITGSPLIYGRIATYIGPNVDFIQIGAN